MNYSGTELKQIQKRLDYIEKKLIKTLPAKTKESFRGLLRSISDDVLNEKPHEVIEEQLRRLKNFARSRSDERFIEKNFYKIMTLYLTYCIQIKKEEIKNNQTPMSIPATTPCILINPKADRLIQIGDYRKLYNTPCAAPMLGVEDASDMCLITMDSYSDTDREMAIDILRWSQAGDGTVRSFYDALVHMHPGENIQPWIKAHQELVCEQEEPGPEL